MNLIEKLFHIKIIPRKRYQTLIERIANCGMIYRKYCGDDYHHGFRTATVPLTELSMICTVENVLWDDVREYLTACVDSTWTARIYRQNQGRCP